MEKSTITIGTRGSALARWQANWVKSELMRHRPDLTVELAIIKTSGDKILDVPLARVGGKGLFVKEIEEALIDGRVDLAVHSMKDMPGETPEGLSISGIPVREVPYDVAITREGNTVAELRRGAKIGTSSLRRASQLLHFRPDFEIVSLRGNLDTRIKKLTSENLDAVILAAAGIKRLGMGEKITEHIAPDIVLPAVGQGALCIETRTDDEEINPLAAALHHEETAHAVLGERAFLQRLQGGCQVPIAAYGTIDDGQLTLTGMVAETDGSVMYHDTIAGSVDTVQSLGTELADRMIARGAGKIVERLIREENQS